MHAIVMAVSSPLSATSFFFLFSSCFMSICNPLGYDRPKASLHYKIKPGSMPFVSSIFALPCRYNLVRLLGISPPEFSQSRSSPSRSFFRSHSSSLSFAPSLPPIPVVLKTLAMAPPLFHPLAGLLTIFSQPGVAIECPLFLVLGGLWADLREGGGTIHRPWHLNTTP